MQRVIGPFLKKKPEEHDIIVAGGGICGVGLAYGLANKGYKVTVIDAPTETNKASRTNVGLIWGQSKFLHVPDYAKWGFMSCRLFPELTNELEQVSGIPIQTNYSGGLIPCLGEKEYSQRGEYIDKLRNALGEYKGGMIDRTELERKLPRIQLGPDVVGAAWCEEDGFVDTLALLRAFRVALPKVGVNIKHAWMHDVKPVDGGYRVFTSSGIMDCERLVLAAGLANRRLARFAIPDLPINADKGQVLLVERMPQVMPVPMLGVTQTFGGTVIIGFRHEFVGHDTRLNPPALSAEGQWAIRVWPELGKRRLIRAWSGLRIMPKDQIAIYSRLPDHPKVSLINTNSGVTLTAAHTRLLPDYILGGRLPDVAQGLTLKRFGLTC